MPRPRPEAAELAERWRIALADAPWRGALGERLGRGTGASLEFQDRRAYAPGDDVRHLDWRAFARTDQLLVRQYREEIQPRVDVVIDASRSMAIDAEKAQATLDLTALFAFAARAEGLSISLIRASERPEPVEVGSLTERGLELDARAPLGATIDAATPLLRPGALRILVSDFLFPHDPRALLQPLLAHAGGLAIVQILARGEREPALAGALRLTDIESEAVRDQVVDPRAVRRYRERLERLYAALETEARRSGARCTSVTAGEPLDRMCRDELLTSGILVPA